MNSSSKRFEVIELAGILRWPTVPRHGLSTRSNGRPYRNLGRRQQAWAYCRRPSWMTLALRVGALASLYVINRNLWALCRDATHLRGWTSQADRVKQSAWVLWLLPRPPGGALEFGAAAVAGIVPAAFRQPDLGPPTNNLRYIKNPWTSGHLALYYSSTPCGGLILSPIRLRDLLTLSQEDGGTQ